MSTLYNYASWAGASFFVTTNEKETKYFNVDKDYLPKELVEVVAIPTSSEFPFAFAPSYFLLYYVPADQYFRSKILL